MKNIKLFFVFCALLFVAPGLSAMEGAQSADESYRSGNFDAALEGYKEELLFNKTAYSPKRAELQNTFLYYNIGNCYYKTGDYGRAVAYYAKAFTLRPREGGIRRNFSLALAATGQSLVPGGVPVVLHKAFYFFSSYELLQITSVCGFIFAVSFCLWLFGRRGRFVWAALGLTVFFGCWYALSAPGFGGRAVIATPAAELRSGPADTFPAAAAVPAGYFCAVRDRKDNWYEVVILKDNLQGWINEESIIEIKEL